MSEHNITRMKYNELKYFCMQYDEKRRELHKENGLNTVKSKAMLQKDIELIEQTASEADAEICEWILKNVTEGIGYEYLGGVPKARKQFYESRRYFFYLLSKKR